VRQLDAERRIVQPERRRVLDGQTFEATSCYTRCSVALSLQASAVVSCERFYQSMWMI
jgi:hypothetical protein